VATTYGPNGQKVVQTITTSDVQLFTINLESGVNRIRVNYKMKASTLGVPYIRFFNAANTSDASNRMYIKSHNVDEAPTDTHTYYHSGTSLTTDLHYVSSFYHNATTTYPTDFLDLTVIRTSYDHFFQPCFFSEDSYITSSGTRRISHGGGTISYRSSADEEPLGMLIGFDNTGQFAKANVKHWVEGEVFEGLN
jgi:hypothetical protein